MSDISETLDPPDKTQVGLFEFWRRCDQMEGRMVLELNRMTENSREITLRTFRKNVGRDELRKWAKAHGYGRGRGELSLAKDWHITYYKSKFAGEVVYYLRWSAFEYIWRRSCA